MGTRQWVAEHRAELAKAYRDTQGTQKERYDASCVIIPELKEKASFNTWKTYIGLLAIVTDGEKEAQMEIQALQAQNEALKAEIATLRESAVDKSQTQGGLWVDGLVDNMADTNRVDNIENRLARIEAMLLGATPKPKIADPDRPETRMIGRWSVIPQKRGNKYYFKAFRRFKGDRNPRCVYIGADASPDVVEAKIRAKGLPVGGETAPAPFDKDKVLKAYEELKKRTGFSNVEISEIVRLSGIPFDQMKPWLLSEAKARRCVIALADWSLASEEVRACAIYLSGKPHLLVRF